MSEPGAAAPTHPKATRGRDIHEPHRTATPLELLFDLTFVIAVGHSDMSFHYISCFASMTMSYMISLGYGVVTSVAVGLLGGAFFGVRASFVAVYAFFGAPVMVSHVDGAVV